jgi:osmotically inducible lipoprotein OsmB
MKKSWVVSCALTACLALTACTMTDTQRRTTTGAALGGATAGLISGEWGWAAAGAAAGAAGGYLYDKSKKNEDDAYNRGVNDSRKR